MEQTEAPRQTSRETRGDVVGSSRVGRRSIWWARSAGILLGSLLLAALTWSASAQALLQRGHVFGGATIGSEGSAPGQLSSPGAVGVDEATDDIYVADRNNNRVEIFHAGGELAGQLESAKGAKISHPEALAIDNSAPDDAGEDPSAGDVYVAQRSGVLKFTAQGKYLATVVGKEQTEAFGVPLGLAVDRHGRLWIDFSEDEILTFDDGEPNVRVGEPIDSELEALAPGLAVDSGENLYVGYEPGEESEEGRRSCKLAPCFVGKLTTLGEPAHGLTAGEPLIYQLDPEASSGVAVDASSDDPYVDNLTSIAAFDAAGAPIERFGGGILQASSGVAVDAKTDTVYAADAATGKVIVFDPAAPAAPTVDSAATLGVSTTTADLQAKIDPHGAETTYTLQYATAPCSGTPASCAESFSCSAGAAVCGEIPAPPGDLGSAFGTQDTPAAVAGPSGLAPGTLYYYRFVAKNANGLGAGAERTFLTRPAAGFATADGREWEQVSPVDKFGNAIEPIRLEGGAIQASADGSAIAYLASGPVSATPEGSRTLEPTQVLSTRDPLDGWSSQDIATPNAEASGVEAGNNTGEYPLFSPNLSLAVVQPFDANRFAAPPLSPPLTQREREEGQESTISLRADAPISPEAAGAQIYAEAKANGVTMSNPGYLALVTDLDAPGVKLESKPFARTLLFEGASPDLTSLVISSSVALTEPEIGTKLPSRRLYEWSAGKLQDVSVLPEGEPALSGAAELGLGEGGKKGSTNVRHAISDDGTKIFWSKAHRLYMRDTLTHETVRVDQPNALETEQGFVPAGAEKAIFQTASADGSRVFFTDTERLVEGSGASEGGGSLSQAKADLYAYEVATRKLTDLTIPMPPVGKKAASEAAGVREVVLGAAEDGSYVYFVADGVLDSGENAQHEKAVPGACPVVGEGFGHRRNSTCNLYVAHLGAGAWGRPRYIATLSSEDGPDWEANQPNDETFSLGNHTAGTSPDGAYLAFMSDRSLTGYDNIDASSGEPDEEVFLYDAATEALLCASCNPSGARPHGVHDIEASGEGLGLLVDRPGTWLEHELEEVEQPSYSSWLAGSIPGWTTASGNVDLAYRQPNYLSDSGRLFFDSPDALVAQDTNEKEDVYEYEPLGVPRGRHSCMAATATFDGAVHGCIGLISSGSGESESAFLDASVRGGEQANGQDGQEGGGDVFFVTAVPLVSQDSDTTFDAYDAHECTTELPCLTPQHGEPVSVCDGEASCKAPFSPPAPSGVATAGGPSSGNLAPQGNVLASKTVVKAPAARPLTRAQKLKRALKACRRLRSKAKRAACERSARKRYEPKLTTKSKRAGQSTSSSGRVKR